MMHAKRPRDTVLVVDDSPETLSMLTDALEGAGMTVLVAIEGAQALAMIEKVTPDVILMDAVMPGMDGFETTRALKRNKAIAHVPVLFMTGLTETEHIVKGFNAGGVDYVTKPIVPDELLARIRVHLTNARLAHSAHAALDASGRHLLAANPEGRIVWCTPQATKLLDRAFAQFDAQSFMLPTDVQSWLRSRLGDERGPGSISLRPDTGDIKLKLSYVGLIGPDEILLRLVIDDTVRNELVLKEKLSLTLREAEVLVWIARGKSNRDIAEILGLSPRTVNKHLEQIYTKIGVENRASAAALTVRALSLPDRSDLP
jgi:DNA-binding response OmpR family regulator/DNA-binding CsgD family transcriptional regulator